MGGSLGPDQVGTGQLGARQGQQGPDGGRGTGDKIVGWGQDGRVGALRMGWGHWVENGILDKGWVLDWGWGSRHGDGIPDMGWSSGQEM